MPCPYDTYLTKIVHVGQLLREGHLRPVGVARSEPEGAQLLELRAIGKSGDLGVEDPQRPSDEAEPRPLACEIDERGRGDDDCDERAVQKKPPPVLPPTAR